MKTLGLSLVALAALTGPAIAAKATVEKGWKVVAKGKNYGASTTPPAKLEFDGARYRATTTRGKKSQTIVFDKIPGSDVWFSSKGVSSTTYSLSFHGRLATVNSHAPPNSDASIRVYDAEKLVLSMPQLKSKRGQSGTVWSLRYAKGDFYTVASNADSTRAYPLLIRFQTTPQTHLRMSLLD